MIDQALALSKEIGLSSTSQATGLARSNLYRWANPSTGPEKKPRPSPSRALSQDEKDRILAVLNSQRFCDSTPRDIYASLLDEGAYLCSWRSMYRLLAKDDLVRERRRGHRHIVYEKPELLAEGPNQLWSWDITRLKGPHPGAYFYLYVILDVFSRYVTGYLLAEHESAELAKKLVDTTFKRQNIAPDQLVLHADRGAPMKADSLACLLRDLHVRKSHSRPHLSDDNPYSEAQFKTLKYHPTFPVRFETIEQARDWAKDFFIWYNHHHYHSALALMHPANVHYKTAEQIREERQIVLQVAFDTHPERFVKGIPAHPKIPDKVWINPPKNQPRKETVALL